MQFLYNLDLLMSTEDSLLIIMDDESFKCVSDKIPQRISAFLIRRPPGKFSINLANPT